HALPSLRHVIGDTSPAWHGSGQTLQAFPVLSEGGSTTCYMAIALTRNTGTVRPPKTSASTLGCRGDDGCGSSPSSWWIGFATPMGVWDKKKGTV
ncbi:Orotate phosphoribosyltransferase, partial [Dissostichus eleginoides]